MSEQIIWWFTSSNPKGQKIPRYMRRSAYHPGEKAVYLPAAAIGSEVLMQVLAGYDGYTVMNDCGHAYVPAAWVKSMFPRLTDTVSQIEARIETEAAKIKAQDEAEGKGKLSR
jgi:hypothetical protein